jgi:hypothetical protein
MSTVQIRVHRPADLTDEEYKWLNDMIVKQSDRYNELISAYMKEYEAFMNDPRLMAKGVVPYAEDDPARAALTELNEKVTPTLVELEKIERSNIFKIAEASTEYREVRRRNSVRKGIVDRLILKYALAFKSADDAKNRRLMQEERTYTPYPAFNLKRPKGLEIW